MFYFDNFKHLYVALKEKVIFPSVSFLHFDPDEAKTIYQILLHHFPGFNHQFKIIQQDLLIGQKKYYSFILIDTYQTTKIGLELRVLSSYAGGAKQNEILNTPQQNFSPSFKSDRIYYYLFMYCIQDYAEKESYITSIKPYHIHLIKNYKIPYMDPEMEPWTVGLFDEIDFEELIHTIVNKIPYQWNISYWKRPFSIERATLIMNLVHIEQKNYLTDAFVKFINNLDQDTFIEESFKTYFSDWKVERCFSRSGNTHWKFVQIPFISF